VLVSVVITVRNEAKNIAGLMESLILQDVEKEIIVVDAISTDGTLSILKDYASRYSFIHTFTKGGKRGEGRNEGIKRAAGEIVAFIDGDCIADRDWLRELLASHQRGDVVAGKTVYVDGGKYSSLERVELYRRGMDVTFPSCNLSYKKHVLERIGMFDPWFITAEDIDLNMRAVDAGFRIVYEERAVVFHRTRENIYSFCKQAFWNGAGRKQLTLKYGRLWSSYKPVELIKRRFNIYSLMRAFCALMGYMAYKLYGERR